MTPIGWMIEGSHLVYTGEFAELDTKSEAKRIGGTCRAFRVYRETLVTKPEPLPDSPPCNPHPDAPHGFSRNASHSAGRYVCDCEGWLPDWSAA